MKQKLFKLLAVLVCLACLGAILEIRKHLKDATAEYTYKNEVLVNEILILNTKIDSLQAVLDSVSKEYCYNNNPLNIRNSSIKWEGQEDKHGAFCSFKSIDYGLRASVLLLKAYKTKHGLNTIKGVVRRWAPPHENNTEAYIRRVCSMSKLTPTQDIWKSPEALYEVVRAMSILECGEFPEHLWKDLLMIHIINAQKEQKCATIDSINSNPLQT